MHLQLKWNSGACWAGVVAVLVSVGGAHAAKEKLVPTEVVPQARVVEGFTMKRFADETQVSNPTAICIDGKGRVYVAETHRWRVQIGDVRDTRKVANGRQVLLDDMSCMSTADRLAYYKKWSGKGTPEWSTLRTHAEKIRRLVDTDGDGVADQVNYYRDDFNDPLSGTAGGLMEKDGTVYFANIPGIYALRDDNNDGVAEEVVTLVDGFGCRVSYSGHDLNGFAWGPDGKLYWSLGDRGYHVVSNGKTYSQPDSGGVFRCNPDGSEFEVFHNRLRNPKEIVFDPYGNLFTVDNNCDAGDAGRLVYVAEHGDTGWHMGHQTLVSFNDVFFPHNKTRGRGKGTHLSSWMAEGIWHTQFPGQPAYILPPIEHNVSGPCGFTLQPGVTSFPERYERSFFIVNYRGAPARSGIDRFTVANQGAGFRVEERVPFLEGLCLTDIDWGYDGKLYMSDFVTGWVKPESGNVYTLTGTNTANQVEQDRIRAWFATGFDVLPTAELAGLLNHKDQRVRQRAQFALVNKPEGEAAAVFAAATATGKPLFERLHGIWGLGQLSVQSPKHLTGVAALLADAEEEVRANAARVLGNHPKHQGPYRTALVKALDMEASPRVASLAGIALANAGGADLLAPAQALLERNADKDVFVRHSGIMMLAKGCDAKTLAGLAKHSAPSVRLAAVVALRRQKASEIQAFFDDADKAVREEAVRGAYDEHLIGAFPALADRAESLAARTYEGEYHPLTPRRAIYAAWTIGGDQRLAAVAGIAANPAVGERIRHDALGALLMWNGPMTPDPVVGTVWEPVADRVGVNQAVLARVLAPLYTPPAEGAPLPPALAQLAVKLADQENLPVTRATLQRIMASKALSDNARLAAFDLLAKNPGDAAAWSETLVTLMGDGNTEIRGKARKLLFASNPERALTAVRDTLADAKTSVREKQLAVQALELADAKDQGAVLADLVGQLADGTLHRGVGLEVLDFAGRSKDKKVQVALRKVDAAFAAAGPLADWKLLCAEGGNAKAGEKLFYNHSAAQCLKCHPLHGRGGKVAPELATIGKDRDLDYIVRALVEPGADIAEGFGAVAYTLENDDVVGGLILPPDAQGNPRLLVGEETVTVPKDRIVEQSEPQSSMPPMHALLSKTQLRDVIAFLATCKENRAEDEHK